MLLSGATRELIEIYDKLIASMIEDYKSLEGQPALQEKMKAHILKARENSRYFIRAYELVRDDAEAYRQIESVQAYRDFLIDDVNLEIAERADAKP